MESRFQFIRKFNELQTAANLAGKIDFPQMVVVGGQSDGKSSLLESIVGRSFLPRGEGIVTRTPIILQLNYCELNQGEWAEIEYDEAPKGQKVDFGQIEKLVAAATVKLAGAEKVRQIISKHTAQQGVIDKPITVKLFSQTLHDLTLVDLPGLVEVPLNSQPVNIAEKIEQLVKVYINNPNAIILAVHQASADIATSKALKMVMEADPDGKRTVFILTKLDLIPASIDKSSLLSGEDLGRVRGMKVQRTIGVINKHGNEDHRAAEKKFFDDPRYKRLRHQHGIDHLITYLSERFRDHIQNKMPRLRSEIDSEISSYKEQIAALGVKRSTKIDDQVDENTHAKESYYVTGVINRFCNFLVRSIDGDVNLKGDQIRGGARLQILFNNDYRANMEKIKVLEGITDEQVAIQIKNSVGAEPGIFFTSKAFKNLVQDEMERMLGESIDCAKSAHKEMLTIRDDAAIRQMEDVRKQYPRLYEEICNIFKTVLDNLLDITKQRVEDCVTMQLDYINVKNPGFAAAKENAERKIADISKTTQPAGSALLIANKNVDTKQDKEVELTRELVSEYFSVIRLTVVDSVPKVIMKFMVNDIKENVQQELLKVLTKPVNFLPLLKEPEAIISRRNDLEAKLEGFLEVAKKMKELTDC